VSKCYVEFYPLSGVDFLFHAKTFIAHAFSALCLLISVEWNWTIVSRVWRFGAKLCISCWLYLLFLRTQWRRWYYRISLGDLHVQKPKKRFNYMR